MNEKYKLYLEKALNELELAKFLFEISESKEKKEQNHLKENTYFYTQVITHSYYCIFYSAKSILLYNDIETQAPEEHKKTVDEFEKNLVKTGKLDLELLKFYKQVIIKAQDLLEIFTKEKTNRGKHTYHILPQAKKDDAKISKENAIKFFRHINNILED